MTRNTIFANPLLGNFSQILNQAFENLETFQTPCPADHQLYSTEDGWVLNIDAPGFAKEDLEIKYKDEALHIRNNADSPFELEKKFTLGKDVDIENVIAKLENGVLEITLPKTNNVQNINIL